MDTITTLRIRRSGDDYEVYLCKDLSVAHRIIREFFSEYVDDYPCIETMEDGLYFGDVGYWEITEEVVLCE